MDAASVPGCFPIPDFGNESLAALKLTRKRVKGMGCTCPDLPSILNGDNSDVGRSLLNLFGTALQLLSKYAELYKSLDAFIELYTPVLAILDGLALDGFPETLTVGFYFLLLVCHDIDIYFVAAMVKFTRDYHSTVEIRITTTETPPSSGPQTHPYSLIYPQIWTYIFQLLA